MEVRRQIYFLPSVSRNHKFNLHLLPDMLRKLNTCFSYGGGVGGWGGEVWRNDFSAISWCSHLPQILGGVFCQGGDKGWRGRAARAVIEKRKKREREEENAATDFDGLISFGFIRRSPPTGPSQCRAARRTGLVGLNGDSSQSFCSLSVTTVTCNVSKKITRGGCRLNF